MGRSTVIYLAGIFKGGTVHPVEAQDFTPVSSCSSGFSSFAGIVCSGNYIDGEVIHCIFNQDFQLGLVCVKWRQTLAGRCPQYLEEHKAIGNFPCTGGELCPKAFFPSYEVYKYPACLNKSLYITEPTTTQADTTEKSSACKECADGGNTGSTTCTETTTKSTLPTDSNCDVVSESSKQSVSCTVPVTIAVIFGILVIFSCLLMVWEYHRGKFLLGMIYEPLRKRCRDRVAKKDVPESHEGADVLMIESAVEVAFVEAGMDVRPRNGSCPYSAADSPQGSHCGAAGQERKAQGSPRLVDNIIEEI